jgi:hypothetical protein
MFEFHVAVAPKLFHRFGRQDIRLLELAMKFLQIRFREVDSSHLNPASGIPYKLFR